MLPTNEKRLFGYAAKRGNTIVAPLNPISPNIDGD